MALQVKINERKFIFVKGDEDVELPDPGPHMSANDVRKFYAAKHPELTNAKIEGPTMVEDKAEYKFSGQIGEKG